MQQHFSVMSQIFRHPPFPRHKMPHFHIPNPHPLAKSVTHFITKQSVSLVVVGLVLANASRFLLAEAN